MSICNKLPPVGYNGQKYAVYCRDGDGKDMLAGWTELADGGALVHMINKHPHWNDPKVIEVEYE